MLDFLILKPEAFGLDISDLSLKIIKLKRKGKFLDLATFGETAIKPGIIEKGELKDEAALSQIIQEALGHLHGEKLKTKYVVASLPEEKTFLQVISLPTMSEEEIKKAVYFEAENYIPLPIDQVYLDAQIVPPLAGHPDHRDVLLVALPQKTVNSYLASLKKAGLKPLVLEIESQAIARALLKKEMSPSPLLLIDLGVTRTSLIIFSGYSLRFTSTISISSRGFTEVIAQNLKIDLEKAEKLKIKYGIKEGKEGQKIFGALTPLLTALTEQIQKHIVYYQSHTTHEHLFNGKVVEKIILCGGGANLKGFADYLSLKLGIFVERGNPWVNILANPPKKIPGLSHQESLEYATALGLALRGLNL